jgi:hypothetical protein
MFCGIKDDAKAPPLKYEIYASLPEVVFKENHIRT